MAVLGTAALALVATIWTTEPQMQVVSGRAQPKTTQRGTPVRWRKAQVTVVIDESVEALGAGATDAIIESFGSWLSHEPAAPRFRFDVRPARPRVGSPDGENRIYRAPIDIEGHEQDLAVTVSYLDESTGAIREADIIINARQPFEIVETEVENGPSRSAHESNARGAGNKAANRGSAHNGRGEVDDGTRADRAEEDWDGSGTAEGSSDGSESTTAVAVGCVDRYDLQSVVTHEVGHFLGLGEDMSDTRATMYARTGRCEINKRNLTDSDVESIATLYAEPFPEDARSTAAAACATHRQYQSPGNLGWAFGLGLLALAVRAGSGRTPRPRSSPGTVIPTSGACRSSAVKS